MSTFCEGCGQPAISATKAGRPICPDCISEGYGDEEQPTAAPDLAAENQRLRAEVEVLREALERVVWSDRFGVKDCLMANGCEHGFKPASSCQNEGCEERQLDCVINTALTRKAPQ